MECIVQIARTNGKQSWTISLDGGWFSFERIAATVQIRIEQTPDSRPKQPIMPSPHHHSYPPVSKATNGATSSSLTTPSWLISPSAWNVPDAIRFTNGGNVEQIYYTVLARVTGDKRCIISNARDLESIHTAFDDRTDTFIGSRKPNSHRRGWIQKVTDSERCLKPAATNLWTVGADDFNVCPKVSAIIGNLCQPHIVFRETFRQRVIPAVVRVRGLFVRQRGSIEQR